VSRYEVREMELHGQPGWVPWDLKLNREAEQPLLPHSHWSPSRERVNTWVARENRAYSSRNSRQSGTPSPAAIK
jgi:hypothetical protein